MNDCKSHHVPNVYYQVAFSLPWPSLLHKLPNNDLKTSEKLDLAI